MQHFSSQRPSLLHLTRLLHQQRWAFGLGLATTWLIGTLSLQVTAEPAATAPAPLKDLLTQVDSAATSKNLAGVMQLYGSNFSSQDGLTRQTLEQALTQFWQRFPNLEYKTELASWQPQANGFVIETVTQIRGMRTEGDRTFKLESTIRTRQQIENQKIVRQEILSERTEIKSGDNPPNLKISLPEQVRPGQEFVFDAIVEEPLGDDLLLGAALEEPVKPLGFVNPTTVALEPLNAGGIFKVGRAPTSGGNHWISAVIVRYDGMTLVTQRLRVTGQNRSSN
jgi:hypothetical protein